MMNAKRTKAAIATLRETIASDVRDLASARPDDRAGIFQHMRWCAHELQALLSELEAHAGAQGPRPSGHA
jgi:hypothetical protein